MGCPVIEYVRADKLEELAAEIEALRADVEVWKATFHSAASGHATYAERTEQLEALVRELEGREQRDEALLRQALAALEQIATDLPWELTGLQADAIAALHERLQREAAKECNGKPAYMRDKENSND